MTLRLLLDQMLDVGVLRAIQQESMDVTRTSEHGLATADDHAILDLAVREQRTLVTLDEHFGDWTFLRLKRHSGVIRIKVNPTSSSHVLAVLMPFLRTHVAADFRDHFFIVSATRVRKIRTA